MSEYGVILEKGASDWQIFQQEEGTGRIELEGRYVSANVLPRFPMTVERDGEEPESVQLRIVREGDGSTVKDWTRAQLLGGGQWRISFPDVPAGGLYRIESCLKYEQWDCRRCTRGDMVHHVGVGDIFLIAGQNNAAGRSKVPVEDSPSTAVHVMRADGKWDMASHPLGETTDMLYTDYFENHNPGHSPWIHFGKLLHRELGYPIGLIPAASGGTPLSWWDSRQEGNLLDCAVKLVGQGGSGIRAMLWSQGEADTGPEAVSYGKRLEEFLKRARERLGRAGLPVLMVQTNRCLSGEDVEQDRGYGLVRQAQLSVMERMEGVWTIASGDLPVSDVMHNSSLADLAIGERCAACALDMIYGRERAWRGPSPAEAWGEGNRVSIFFRDTVHWLELHDLEPERLPVEAEDGDGFLPLVNYRTEMTEDGCLLELQFARTARGEIKVHGAWRAYPGAAVPVDGRGLPMYGFYGLTVCPAAGVSRRENGQGRIQSGQIQQIL